MGKYLYRLAREVTNSGYRVRRSTERPGRQVLAPEPLGSAAGAIRPAHEAFAHPAPASSGDRALAERLGSRSALDRGIASTCRAVLDAGARGSSPASQCGDLVGQ